MNEIADFFIVYLLIFSSVMLIDDLLPKRNKGFFDISMLSLGIIMFIVGAVRLIFKLF